MTSKELLYVEDALGHEQFMQKCAQDSSNQIQDPTLANYLRDLNQVHTNLFNKFFDLL